MQSLIHFPFSPCPAFHVSDNPVDNGQNYPGTFEVFFSMKALENAKHFTGIAYQSRHHYLLHRIWFHHPGL